MEFFLQTLGTGSADQIPVHCCTCTNCIKARKNKDLQRRPSTNLIKWGKTSFFIDYGFHPIFDSPIDFILISHMHLDHCKGLLDLKWSAQEKPVDLYLPKGLDLNYVQNFLDHYTLIDPFFEDQRKYRTIFEFKQYKNLEKTKIQNIEVTPVPLNHDIPASGFCIQIKNVKLAYLLDTKKLPEVTKELLLSFKPDIMLVDTTFASHIENKSHNTIREAIDLIIEINVSMGILTHISHGIIFDQEFLRYKQQAPNKSLESIQVATDNRIFNLSSFLD